MPPRPRRDFSDRDGGTREFRFQQSDDEKTCRLTIVDTDPAGSGAQFPTHQQHQSVRMSPLDLDRIADEATALAASVRAARRA